MAFNARWPFYRGARRKLGTYAPVLGANKHRTRLSSHGAGYWRRILPTSHSSSAYLLASWGNFRRQKSSGNESDSLPPTHHSSGPIESAPRCCLVFVFVRSLICASSPGAHGCGAGVEHMSSPQFSWFVSFSLEGLAFQGSCAGLFPWPRAHPPRRS